MRKIRNNRLPAKESFVVLGDGGCEKWYLEMLSQNHRNLSMRVEPQLSIKKKLLDKFDQVKKLAKVYDKVIWIVDYDVILKETREKKKGIKQHIKKFENLRLYLAKNI